MVGKDHPERAVVAVAVHLSMKIITKHQKMDTVTQPFSSENRQDKETKVTCKELPELVNITERYVLSFRVLNNPLNGIPTLQIYTERQGI